MDHTQNAFTHLTKIHLMINPHGQTERRFHDCSWTLRSGNIARNLTAARGLTHLELGLSCTTTDVLELSKLVDIGAWPSLKVIGLSNMAVEEQELENFLTRHSKSLKSLSLSWAFLSQFDSWGKLGLEKPWNDAFRSLDVLHLDKLNIETYQSDFVNSYWERNDPATISRFLATGEDMWFGDAGAEIGEDEQQEWIEQQLEDERRVKS